MNKVYLKNEQFLDETGTVVPHRREIHVVDRIVRVLSEVVPNEVVAGEKPTFSAFCFVFINDEERLALEQLDWVVQESEMVARDEPEEEDLPIPGLSENTGVAPPNLLGVPDEPEEEEEVNETPVSILAPIEQLGLGPKQAGALRLEGLTEVDDLVGMSQSDLEAIDGIGPKTSALIVQKIKAILGQ